MEVQFNKKEKSEIDTVVELMQDMGHHERQIMVTHIKAFRQGMIYANIRQGLV